MGYILTVTANPLIDRTLVVDELEKGKIYRARETSEVVGGKGINVARLIRNLGTPVEAVTFTGDFYGEHLERLLAKEKIPHHCIHTQSPTRFQVSIRERESNLHTDIIDPGSVVQTQEADALYYQVELLIKYGAEKPDWLVLSGSAPRGEANDLYARLTRLGNQNQIPVFLDSYGEMFNRALPEKPYAVKPNLKEAEQFSGKDLSSRENQVSFIRELRKMGIAMPILSLGEKGLLALAEGELLCYYPPKVDAVNVTGSGDALVAAFVVSRGWGMSLWDALLWGTAAGTANALQWEPCNFGKEEIEVHLPFVRVEKLGRF
jgi:tagatose 6-phosphate kinase